MIAPALAEGRFAEAVEAFRDADMAGHAYSHLPLLAQAFDRWGQADSAIAAFERFLDRKHLGEEPIRFDALYIPGVHKRLGELYEAKGDRERALASCRAFLALWRDADPGLRPRVRDALQRVDALTRGSDARR